MALWPSVVFVELIVDVTLLDKSTVVSARTDRHIAGVSRWLIRHNTKKKSVLQFYVTTADQA